jgi:hypothetical protein
MHTICQSGVLSLAKPAEQTQHAKTGSEEWEGGWERGYAETMRTRNIRRQFGYDEVPLPNRSSKIPIETTCYEVFH